MIVLCNNDNEFLIRQEKVNKRIILSYETTVTSVCHDNTTRDEL